MESLADKLVVRLPYLLLGGVLGWVVVHAWAPLSDPDSWWHLRLGEDLLQQRSLATPEHWSSFATVPWVPSEPLPEIVVALVHRVGGLPAVVWLYVATLVVLVVAVYLVCRLRATALPAAVATVLFVAAGQGSLTARPQLVSFVLLLVVIEAWRRSEQDLVPRWWLIPLTWLWSLCHGFWFIGVGYGVLAVVAVALGRKAARRDLLRLAATAIGAGVVVVVSPLGLDVVEAPFKVSQVTHYVTEWQRPGLTNGPALTVTAMVLAVVVIWLVRRSGVTWFTGFLLASALVWDWYAQRTVVVGALVAAPLLAAALQSLLAAAEPGSGDATPQGVSSGERWAVLGGAGAFLLLAAFVVPFSADTPGKVPTALDAQLDRLPAGTPVFNAYELGGWITWRHPDLDQYIDGLITPYSLDHVEGYHRTQVLLPGWYAVVRDSQAPVALVEADSTLAAALQRRGWTSSGSDAGYVLLHRPQGDGG